MSRKILAASVLVIASAIGFCAQAQAETVDVPFSGTIAPKCTFSNTAAGTLALGSQTKFIEGSSTHGTQGSVNIFCNTAASVSVGEPVQQAGSGPSTFAGANPQFEGSIIAVGANRAGSPRAVATAWQGVSAASLSVPAITDTKIDVAMVEDAIAPVQAGVYNFTVTLTSTP